MNNVLETAFILQWMAYFQQIFYESAAVLESRFEISVNFDREQLLMRISHRVNNKSHVDFQKRSDSRSTANNKKMRKR